MIVDWFIRLVPIPYRWMGPHLGSENLVFIGRPGRYYFIVDMHHALVRDHTPLDGVVAELRLVSCSTRLRAYRSNHSKWMRV